MNKNYIDTLVPDAYEALKNQGIVCNGEIVKTYRSQVSTFGAALTNGSILSAIAFFSDKASSSVDRPKILACINELIQKEKNPQTNLFEYAKTEIQKGNKRNCKEDILNAAIALKLAMNLYTLVEAKKQRGSM